MRRQQRIFLLALLVAALGSSALSPLESSSRISPVFAQGGASEPASQPHENLAQASGPRIGIISYWELSATDWKSVPDNSILLINPHNGIIKPDRDEVVDDWQAWKQLADTLKNKVVLGYVPTGYFDHVGCQKVEEPKCQSVSRIRLQVKTYYEKIPNLSGIFFDEASPKEKGPSDFKKEYELLRSTNLPGHLTVFNVGSPSVDAVKFTKPGEHLVLYESSPFKYLRDAKEISALTCNAQEKGIVVWHLIHSVCREDMHEIVTKVIESRANYGYVTDVGGDWEAGENTWGRLPRYWEDELAAFSAQGAPCPRKK